MGSYTRLELIWPQGVISVNTAGFDESLIGEATSA